MPIIFIMDRKANFKKRLRQEEGFTLLEMIVVIGILMLLSAVAVLVTTNQREKAAKAQVISDLRNIAPIMEEYELTFLRYPEFLPDTEISEGVDLELTREGTCVVGTHENYDDIIWYYDSVRNVITDGGCEEPPVDDPLLGVVDAAVYAGNYFTSTNAWTIIGEGADMYVAGDYSCNSYVTSTGDVIVHGDVYLTNQCYIGGSLYATGDVRMTSNVQIVGSIYSLGSVTMTNTCGGGSSSPCSSTSVSIGGDIRTYYKDGEGGYANVVVVGDGTTEAHLNSKNDYRPANAAYGGPEVLGGQIINGDTSIEVPEIPFPRLYFNPNPVAHQTGWLDVAQTTMTANGAASWVTKSCNMTNASWSLNGNITIPQYTVINAISDCPGGLTLSGHHGAPMTFTLYGDLTIYANRFTSNVGGIRFLSGDGAQYNVRIISPLPVGATNPGDIGVGSISNYGINIASSPLTTDSNIAVLLYSPGTLHFGGGTNMRGQAIGGNISTSGTVIIDYVPVGEW